MCSGLLAAVFFVGAVLALVAGPDPLELASAVGRALAFAAGARWLLSSSGERLFVQARTGAPGTEQASTVEADTVEAEPADPR